LIFVADKAGFETFSAQTKLASLRAFFAISTNTSSPDALLNSLVASIVASTTNITYIALNERKN
jgi:hypothetical protein